jgi:hypothetical protein
MLFVHPMWDNESERIGKQKCTPFGYALHGIADLLGIIGLFLLIGIAGYLVHRGIAGTFRPPLLCILMIPFSLGLVGNALFRLSWMLARRRGFEYDYVLREASWIENGRRVRYRYEQNTMPDHSEQYDHIELSRRSDSRWDSEWIEAFQCRGCGTIFIGLPDQHIALTDPEDLGATVPYGLPHKTHCPNCKSLWHDGGNTWYTSQQTRGELLKTQWAWIVSEKSSE